MPQKNLSMYINDHIDLYVSSDEQTTHQMIAFDGINNPAFIRNVLDNDIDILHLYLTETCLQIQDETVHFNESFIYLLRKFNEFGFRFSVINLTFSLSISMISNFRTLLRRDGIISSLSGINTKVELGAITVTPACPISEYNLITEDSDFVELSIDRLVRMRLITSNEARALEENDEDLYSDLYIAAHTSFSRICSALAYIKRDPILKRAFFRGELTYDSIKEIVSISNQISYPTLPMTSQQRTPVDRSEVLTHSGAEIERYFTQFPILRYYFDYKIISKDNVVELAKYYEQLNTLLSDVYSRSHISGPEYIPNTFVQFCEVNAFLIKEAEQNWHELRKNLTYAIYQYPPLNPQLWPQDYKKKLFESQGYREFCSSTIRLSLGLFRAPEDRVVKHHACFPEQDKSFIGSISHGYLYRLCLMQPNHETTKWTLLMMLKHFHCSNTWHVSMPVKDIQVEECQDQPRFGK